MKNFTKKLGTAIAALALGLCGLSAQAQSFTQMSPYDTIAATPTTLNWDILNPDTVAWGTAQLTVYYDGDFGATVEYITIYGENNYQIGVTIPHFDGSDCMLDSVTLNIPASYINTWAADDTIHFSGITTSDVDFFCTNNHVRVKLTYNYCPNGSGSQGPFAGLTIPATSFCSIDPAVTLNATPAGGTLTGQGISGNTFNPAMLAPGNYTLSYTYTNAGGCTSTDQVMVNIKPGPMGSSNPDSICPGNTAILSATGNGHMIWYSDAALNNQVGTGYTITSPMLITTTTFYAATTLIDKYFTIDSLGSSNSVTVDHDAISGDDRGGIAVTQNYVYVAGDDSIARYDLNLQNGMGFERIDAFFSDLGTGQLYTLYNPATGIPSSNNIDSMYVTEIRSLNADLTLGTAVITLSDSIPFGYDVNYNISGIFAGNGFVIIYTPARQAWYVIDLTDGVVTKLGTLADPEFNWSENWSVWGVAQFDGTNYSALFRDYNDNNIHSRVLPSQASTIAATFSDLSDLASFTYAPWNNRWYFHYEGSSSQFGGGSETLGYAAAGDSTGSEVTGATLDCPAAITVVVLPCVSIEEQSASFVSIAPNPNNGMFSIAISNIQDAQVDIISMDGRLVYSERFTGSVSSKDVDLSSAANGVYYVRVSNANVVKTAKLIKQ
jgi:hypothetical protein